MTYLAALVLPSWDTTHQRRTPLAEDGATRNMGQTWRDFSTVPSRKNDPLFRRKFCAKAPVIGNIVVGVQYLHVQHSALTPQTSIVVISARL